MAQAYLGAVGGGRVPWDRFHQSLKKKKERKKQK